MRKIICISLLMAATQVWAQDKKNDLDLEDVAIRGEATKVGLGLSSRAKNTLDGRIFIRKDFRDRILEEMPEYLKNQTPTAKAESTP
jgi:hypothetical protein